MPRDLFQEAAVNPYQDSDETAPPRDLFAESGVNYPIDNSPQWAKTAANSAPVQALLGGGDATQNMLANLVNLAGFAIPLAKSGNGLAYDVGNVAGNIADFFLPMGVTSKGLEALKGIPATQKLASSLLGEGVLPSMGRNAIAGAGYGALMNPNDRFSGAAVEGTLGGIGGALGEGINQLAPSKFLKSTLSPDELVKNLDITQGTGTGLGDVLGNPFLKRQFENVLPKVWGSGANEAMQNTAKQVAQKGQDLLNQVLGDNDPQGFKIAIQDALKSAQKDAVKMKQTNYNEVNKLADQQGIVVPRDNFSNQANDILKDIKLSPELEREIPTKLLNNLQSYANPENSNTLRLSNIFRGKINDKASQAYQNGDKYQYGIYSNLKNALDSDIENVIPRDSSNPLRQKYDEAQNYYRTNIAPFEDPAITKFTREGGDPDLILSSFIKTGVNDRTNLLNKVLNKLPEEKKGLLSYGYLSQAVKEGNLNPLKMKSLYESLGENQKEALFSQPGIKKSMDNFSKLVQMNTRPLNAMTNLMTGQQALDVLPYAVATHAIGALGGYEGGGVPGAVLGGALGLGSAALISKAITKKLTSESIRNSLVNKIIKNSSKEPSNNNFSAALSAALGQEMQ